MPPALGGDPAAGQEAHCFSFAHNPLVVAMRAATTWLARSVIVLKVTSAAKHCQLSGKRHFIDWSMSLLVWAVESACPTLIGHVGVAAAQVHHVVEIEMQETATGWQG